MSAFPSGRARSCAENSGASRTALAWPLLEARRERTHCPDAPARSEGSARFRPAAGCSASPAGSCPGRLGPSCHPPLTAPSWWCMGWHGLVRGLRGRPDDEPAGRSRRGNAGRRPVERFAGSWHRALWWGSRLRHSHVGSAQRGRQVRISKWAMCASGWIRPVSTSHWWMAAVTSPPLWSTRRAKSAASNPPVAEDP